MSALSAPARADGGGLAGVELALEALEVGAHLARDLIAKVGIFFERLIDDAFEFRGKIRVQADGRGGRAVEDGVKDDGRGVAREGLAGERGMFTAEALEEAIRPRSRYAPPQKLVEVEQTANRGGGACWSVEQLRSVSDTAHEHGLATHMDGARLLNAAVALGRPATEFTAGCDSVWLDFSKGLAAPMCAVLAGSKAFIGEAWRWKQRLGGAMRQGGICAAACLYALDHNVERLADDHANARTLARGLAQIPGIVVEAPETNLVFFDTEATGMTAPALAAKLRVHGVLVSTSGTYRARACLHLDIAAAQVDEALALIRQALHA